MNATTLIHDCKNIGAAQAASFYYEDPLDADDVADPTVTTTRRGLTRLALVAAETGARFQRDEVGHDPMAWMLSGRRLFGGRAAIEACLDRDHCLRAILLHGLAIGLDAKPESIDALIADEPPAEDPDDSWPAGSGGVPGGSHRSRRLRLYTATVVVARGGELLQAFHASIAPSAAVIRERVRSRFGSVAAARAEIRVGFDPACPATLGMVPPLIVDTLTRAGHRVRWAALAGLDVTVEQRLPS